MNNSITFFVKFFDDEEHADNFIKGSIFSNRFSHFKKLEAQVYIPHSLQPVINKNDATPIKRNWQDYINVFCIFAGRDGEIEIPQECQKLGKFAVVINNIGEFFDRIHSSIRFNDYRMTRSLVEYFDPATAPAANESIFRKRHDFDYQNEYRFAISTGIAGTEPVILDIGDISDISTKCENFCVIESYIKVI